MRLASYKPFDGLDVFCVRFANACLTMFKCLRITLIADETFTADQLETQASALVDQGRYTFEKTDQPLTVVVHAKDYAFNNCVVWSGVLLRAWKNEGRIGEYRLEALNCQFHNEIMIKDYNVEAPEDVFQPSKQGCVIL
jgi:hypothetical protein